MPNILIVEDEINMNNIIFDYFINENFNVYQSFNGEDAIKIFYDKKIDLVILDIMLPGKDGFKVLEEIRDNSSVLVIILTALESEENKIKGFDLGADEYVTKPFSPKVLVARAKSLLKRNNLLHNKIIKTNNIEVNINERTVKLDSSLIELTKKEFDLMVLFSSNPNKVLSRDTILGKIWGYNYFGDGRVVDTYIKNLRKKLRPNEYIKTVIGVGYKYVCENKK